MSSDGLQIKGIGFDLETVAGKMFCFPTSSDVRKASRGLCPLFEIRLSVAFSCLAFNYKTAVQCLQTYRKETPSRRDEVCDR